VDRKSFSFENILAWFWNVLLLSGITGSFIFGILDESGLIYYLDRVRPTQLKAVWLIFTSMGSSVFCILLFRYLKSRYSSFSRNLNAYT